MIVLHGIPSRWRRAVSGTALAASVTALVASAVFATGYTARHADLNDGGIWVTSDRDGEFGRVNKPAGQLDGFFNPPGQAQEAYQLDVLQDGSAVAAWDRAAGRLYPVDVDRAVAQSDQSIPVPAVDRVELAGGTLALLDPRAGQVWAMRVSAAGLTSLAAIDPTTAAPTAKLGATGAALAVGVDGAVHALSAAGKTVTISVGHDGTFAAPVYGRLGSTTAAGAGLTTQASNPGRSGTSTPDPSRSGFQATAVGSHLIAFDTGSGTLSVAGGPTVQIPEPDPAAVLQMPGPDAPAVVVATPTALDAVDLSSGSVTVLYHSGTGTPAAPVLLDGCVNAAWAGSAFNYVQSCDGRPAARGDVDNALALIRPVFRQNRGSLVLNDLTNGAVWDLTDQRRVDDWSATHPPPSPKAGDPQQNNGDDNSARKKPPKAVDDHLGARPGRTTLLHVLDNDSDPAGSILAVSQVTKPVAASAGTAISPDGQTVALTLGPDARGTVEFRYTIDDGKGLSASAAVTVTVRTADENGVPQLRTGYQSKPYPVTEGARLDLPVLADWRDPDGDPLSLASATAKAGTAVASPDGFLDYTAPATPGTQTVNYQVSDGVGTPVSGTVTIAVQAPTARPTAAVTEPDLARGEVGRPIVVHPLDNDLPGSDPLNPSAELALASTLASPAGTQVATDQRTGTVTIAADRPGTFVLSYTARFGDAPFAPGTIRVDVVAVPATAQPPVTVPITAVLHGQQPTRVDVPAADYDPSGALLAVQGATPSDPGQLAAAVVDGRWVSIRALTPTLAPASRIVRYTITDGQTAPVTGEITVTQLPPPDVDTPVAGDSEATVRAGDSVAVPVLDDDTDPGGAPLSLDADVQGVPIPGTLRVTGPDGGTTGVGSAYVAGSTVRYAAPASVLTPLTVEADYVVRNPEGGSAVGRVHITVEPLPSPSNPNRSPEPYDVEARAVAGDTITIPIATVGADPDGDSVAVTGLASAPALGRVLSWNATSLTYQAFPTVSGTDEFEYRVVDPYGGSGTASLRIAVVPPGPPQPPVAVDDDVTAAPGARIAVDVLANDLIAPDDAVTLEPLAKLNPDLPAGTAQTGPRGPIQLTAPAANGRPLVVSYGVGDGVGTPSLAVVTVHGRVGYDIPAVCADAYPKPAGAASATVDIAKQCSDPDDPGGPIVVTRAFDAHAQVSAGQVVVPLDNRPHVVAFEVRDAGGALSLGLIHVPAAGTGAPYVRDASPIAVPATGSTTVDLAGRVADPAGKPVRLTTTDRLWTAPRAGLTVRSQGVGQLVLSAAGGYTGPAAVTFEVTDGSSLTDPAAQVTVLTIPVQVGRDTPVLRCPSDPLTLVEGGPAATLDLVSVCHVWVGDPATLAGLRYTAAWHTQVGGMSLPQPQGSTLTLAADGKAVPGAQGSIDIGVAGFASARSTLAIAVEPAPPPSVVPITVDGVKAGETRTVNLDSYVRSELRDPAVSVVSVHQESGLAATATVAGATVRVTPGAASKGTMTFSVAVSDVADRTRADRIAVGLITLHVLGLPDAPGAPVVGRTVLSHSVDLSWAAPADNGAPILSYEVDAAGHRQTCPGSPCTIMGLTNGTAYSFTVRATNLVGQGQPSTPSAPAVPNTVPGAVTGLAASLPQDGTLHLTWNPPPDDGTPVQTYLVTWTGGGRQSVTVSSVTATGLANDAQYTFTVVAVNAQGTGPSVNVTGQSAGIPKTPGAPTLTSVDSADAASRAVSVSWTPVDPNGPSPTTYTVTRTGNGTKTVCTNVAAAACTDDGLANDGTVYSYTVTAANADAGSGSGHSSPPGPAAQMVATATPDPITGVSATPTGTDGQARLQFDAPASHGASSTVRCTWSGGSCGTWTMPASGQSHVTETVDGLPNGTTVTLNVSDCNGSPGGAYAGNPCDSTVGTDITTYGPLKNLAISTSANAQTVNFTVSVDPNGRPATVTVRTSKQTQTFNTGTSGWSWSGSDTMGYSATDTITVTVSDSGRASLNQSAQQSTPAPPPPPPSPTVTVTKGTACGGGGGTACKGGSCTDKSCAYVHVQTANFGGTVSCSFNSDHGNGGWFLQTYGPNDSHDSINWYGWPGTTVTVTCNGVVGSMRWY
ncbi:hypothetical protein ABH920_006340 [Catenulispora sp. EB89]|uniref:Ig-like domain-containing protein n=1 Tax=Catenulispora sp. EB89 TaxID=3156257 RepID=UPI003517D364